MQIELEKATQLTVIHVICRSQILHHAIALAVLPQHVPEEYHKFLDAELIIKHGPEAALQHAEAYSKDDSTDKPVSKKKGLIRELASFVASRAAKVSASLKISGNTRGTLDSIDEIMRESRRHAALMLRSRKQETEAFISTPDAQPLLRLASSSCAQRLLCPKSTVLQETRAGMDPSIGHPTTLFCVRWIRWGCLYHHAAMPVFQICSPDSSSTPWSQLPYT